MPGRGGTTVGGSLRRQTRAALRHNLLQAGGANQGGRGSGGMPIPGDTPRRLLATFFAEARLRGGRRPRLGIGIIFPKYHSVKDLSGPGQTCSLDGQRRLRRRMGGSTRPASRTRWMGGWGRMPQRVSLGRRSRGAVSLYHSHPARAESVEGKFFVDGRFFAETRWIFAAKAVMTALVLWAVGRHVLRTWNDIRQHEIALQISAGLVRALGPVLPGRAVALRTVLRATCCRRAPRRSPSLPAMRAYLISHLGKYVPGKAMVVVMRARMSAPHGARASTSAIATFYETLVMMASGGLIAAFGFATAGPSPGLRFRFPTGNARPGTLSARRFARPGAGPRPPGRGLASRVPEDRDGRQPAVPERSPDALPQFTGGLLVQGLLWTAASWISLGLQPGRGGSWVSAPGQSELVSRLAGGDGRCGAGDGGGVRRRGRFPAAWEFGRAF